MAEHLERPATAAERANVRAMHESNRTAWNEGAAHYTKGLPDTIEYIRSGRANLLPVELEHLGDLRGRVHRAIHLQCASGKDTLSLWNLGADEVVGVDISDVHIANAQALTAAVGAPATWYRCDVLETPHELDGTADLVYTGRGAIDWLHDLGAWARVCARLLAPGGRLYVFEGHPVEWLVEVVSGAWSPPDFDYFGGYVLATQGWSPEYIGRLDRPDAELSRKFERPWTIGEIIQSVIDAGLRIDRFTEHPDAYWDSMPDVDERIRTRVPRTFSLLASRPSG